MIVGAIVRNDRVLIPTGDSTIEVDDRVVVVCSPTAIAAVERFFGSR